MQPFVPPRTLAVSGCEVELQLALIAHMMQVPQVLLARPGQPLLCVEPGVPPVCRRVSVVPELLRMAAAVRQRLTIADLATSGKFSEGLRGLAPASLRFFASVPLIAASGTALGALCIVDTVPRQLGREDLARLEDAGRVLAALIGDQRGEDAVARLGADLVRATAEARARAASELRYKKMYERASAQAQIGVWECDLATSRLTWTDGVYDMFELPRGSLVTRELVLALYDPASRREMEELRQQAIDRCSGFSLEVRVRAAGGTPKWIRLTAEVEVEDGAPVRIFGLKQDITQEHILLEQLRVTAERDALTGLANRAMFERSLGRPGLAGARPRALVLIDLDGFKAVNDTYGHSAGDACLVEVARRLQREFAGAELIARIGGDEFAVLMEVPQLESALESRVRSALAALTAPMRHGGQVFAVGASIGVARALEALAPQQVFARADQAMYAAKNSGRNCVRIHSDQPESARRVS